MKTRNATADSDSTREESGTHAFESVDSAHEYVGLLLQSIQETAVAVGEDLHHGHVSGSPRRREAFQLIAYKLERLRIHIDAGRRLLKDLRTLRGMLKGENPARSAI